MGRIGDRNRSAALIETSLRKSLLTSSIASWPLACSMPKTEGLANRAPLRTAKARDEACGLLTSRPPVD